MAKVWTYLTVFAGLTFLLKLAGIPTGLEWLLNFVGITDDLVLNSSAFYTAIVASLGLVTGASIVIGAFGRTAPEYALIAPFVTANVLIFISTFVSISVYMNNFGTWLSYPITALMLVFGVGFVWSAYSYVFGRDS